MPMVKATPTMQRAAPKRKSKRTQHVIDDGERASKRQSAHPSPASPPPPRPGDSPRRTPRASHRLGIDGKCIWATTTRVVTTPYFQSELNRLFENSFDAFDPPAPAAAVDEAVALAHLRYIELVETALKDEVGALMGSVHGATGECSVHDFLTAGEAWLAHGANSNCASVTIGLGSYCKLNPFTPTPRHTEPVLEVVHNFLDVEHFRHTLWSKRCASSNIRDLVSKDVPADGDNDACAVDLDPRVDWCLLRETESVRIERSKGKTTDEDDMVRIKLHLTGLTVEQARDLCLNMTEERSLWDPTESLALDRERPDVVHGTIRLPFFQPVRFLNKIAEARNFACLGDYLLVSQGISRDGFNHAVAGTEDTRTGKGLAKFYFKPNACDPRSCTAVIIKPLFKGVPSFVLDWLLGYLVPKLVDGMVQKYKKVRGVDGATEDEYATLREACRLVDEVEECFQKVRATSMHDDEADAERMLHMLDLVHINL